MDTIANLTPQPLWHWFAEICAIPHPSKHEAQLKTHIKQWAAHAQIDVSEDEIGNLILRKPATNGMKNRKPVVIQAHLDMVPQANSDTNHNFESDPIQPYIIKDEATGELWVTAKGTTLGADNGIGMASALAVLSSQTISHPDLEVLLTVDEEAGMTGAFGLKPGLLNADILINTDSEQEGEIYMGCAGGVDAELSLPFSAQPLVQTDNIHGFKLSVSGLKGGHSGCNIHMGRANAIKVLGRFFYQYAQHLDIQLATIQGGTLRNAIPREASADFVINQVHIEALNALITDYQATLCQELSIADPNVQLVLTPVTLPSTVFEQASQNTLFAMLHLSPNGVMRMSDDIDGVVETSLNLGVLTTEASCVKAMSLIRSLDDSSRDNTVQMMQALAELSGAHIELSGAYPGWKPDSTSPVMAIVRDVYEDLYHKKPEIMVIHAGLECGLFKEPYPDMDMVSIGPTIRYPHSPDEKVLVSTVDLYWQLLLAILKNIPERA